MPVWDLQIQGSIRPMTRKRVSTRISLICRGAFRDNGDFLLVDEDGLFVGSVEAGVWALCYLEAGATHQVASFREFKKQ